MDLSSEKTGANVDGREVLNTVCGNGSIDEDGALGDEVLVADSDT